VPPPFDQVVERRRADLALLLDHRGVRTRYARGLAERVEQAERGVVFGTVSLLELHAEARGHVTERA